MEKIKNKLNSVQISNVVLYDKQLSLKAKGLYAYLFSKPDGWEFHTPVILSEIKESRDAFYSAVKELINRGYIRKYQININGRFGGCIYEFVSVDEIPNKHKEQKND